MDPSTCPVLRPTLKEFSKGLEAYVESVDDDLRAHGLIKVIPPAGWRKKKGVLSGKRPPLPATRFPEVRAIKQAPSGSRGVYQMAFSYKSAMSAEAFREEALRREPSFDTADASMVERRFWQSLTSWGTAPLYGADTLGSLFGDDPASGWNLNHLQTMLHRVIGEMPGITKAMLYYGTWRALFAFHKEDMDLYSINYLHYGAPKAWYGVPPAASRRLEALASVCFGEVANHCKQFMRHKTSVLSPKQLDSSNIPFVRVVQYPGEFVITYPTAYHQGFNYGFNIAEAVNFATRMWLPFGRKAALCRCRPDYVFIDMADFVHKLRKLQPGLELEDSGSESEGEEGDTSEGSHDSGAMAGAGGDTSLIVEGIQPAIHVKVLVLATAPPGGDFAIHKGRTVMCKRDGKWVLCRMVDVDGRKLRLRYIGYGMRLDEWVDQYSTRLRPVPPGAVPAVPTRARKPRKAPRRSPAVGRKPPAKRVAMRRSMAPATPPALPPQTKPPPAVVAPPPAVMTPPPPPQPAALPVPAAPVVPPVAAPVPFVLPLGAAPCNGPNVAVRWDDGTVYSAVVIATHGSRWYVHYPGWVHDCNEWIDVSNKCMAVVKPGVPLDDLVPKGAVLESAPPVA